MASACSRMCEMVLDDLGRIGRCSRMRTWVLETSGKLSVCLALKGYRFAHSGSAADNFTETRRVRSARETTKMLRTFGL